MNKLFLLASLALTGCAGMEPLTPEQAAALMYMQQSQQSNNANMMLNMQANPVFQPMQRPQIQYVAPPRPINCTTTNGGYSLYTTCQ